MGSDDENGADGAAAEAAVGRAQYEVLASFRHALRAFLVFSEHAARDVGLTPQQHQAMLAIKGFPGRERASVGELAERLLIRHHSAVELVDRLCDAGLARREGQPGDRRRVMVVLTEQAERLLRQLSAAHWEELRRMRPALTMLVGSLEGAAPE